MSKFAYAVSFLLGGAVGAIITKKYMERKIDEAVQEYLPDAVKQALDEGETETDIPEENTEANIKEPVVECEHISVVNHYKPTADIIDADKSGPYVISPLEFADFEDYAAISLTYTSDGVLLDDAFEPVEDIATTVGEDFALHFGVYPDDPNTVYIRNDDLCSDYEICKDLRTAEEFDKEKAHMRWRDNE
jgi:hypothetical protein